MVQPLSQYEKRETCGYLKDIGSIAVTREGAVRIGEEWRRNKHSTYTQEKVCSVMMFYSEDDMQEIVEPYEEWISNGRPMEKKLREKWYAKFSKGVKLES